MNTLDAAYAPHQWKELFIGGEFAGLEERQLIRPIVQYKQFFPMQKREMPLGTTFKLRFITALEGSSHHRLNALTWVAKTTFVDSTLEPFPRSLTYQAHRPSLYATRILHSCPRTHVSRCKLILRGHALANCWNIPVPYFTRDAGRRLESAR